MDHSVDWLTAFEALKSVYIDGAYSNMALNEAIPRHKGCRDSFVRNLVKETVRQTVTADYIIGKLADRGLRGIRNRTLIIIRIGLCAIREMDSVPDHAAVNEAVALAGKTARGTGRFINAILREYLRRRDEFEPVITIDDAGADRRLSVQYSMPEDIVSLIARQYGDETENILKGLNTPPGLVLRVNTLKITRESLITGLRHRGIDADALEETDRAVTARGSGIMESDLYREGMFTVQGLSSILSVEALAPEPGSKVLDMCAAPGGKSTMMAEMMENTGTITACDIHEHRLQLIRASAERTGADIIKTKLADGTVHDSMCDEKFDCVLADVPCSGLGVISTKPEIRLKTDVSSLSALSDTQLAILKNAFRYTRPGGRVCYSTCTLNKQENEEVVRRFMNETGTTGFARIVEMNTFLPYNNLIGFYYSIIEKNAFNCSDR